MKLLIARFLQSQRSVALVYYANVLVLWGLIWLLEPTLAVAHFTYALLLSTTMFVCYLFIRWLRWLPIAKVHHQRVTSSDLDAYAHPQRHGTSEQQTTERLIHHLYQLAAKERMTIEQVHAQHVTFLYLWVHQMKLPISTLSLMMQQATPQTMQEQEQIASMREEIDRLHDGLEMAMSMARLNDFSLDYRIRPISLLAQVREVIQAKKRVWIRTRIFPEVIADEADWDVLTDAKWHHFVLEQIIQNAIKYSSQQRQQSHLTFHLSKSQQQIELAISDQGPGIPLEDLPRVYDAFFTGTNGRAYAGATGMGLFLVKRVCDELGHQIQIESTPGSGTTVRLMYEQA